MAFGKTLTVMDFVLALLVPQLFVAVTLIIPLVAEVLTEGLQPFKQINLWDNIHWWGAKLGIYPTTPGAFHAGHMHWRWGTAATEASPQPQFNLSGIPSTLLNHEFNRGIGEKFRMGALVDPNCWIQTIRFAIVLKASIAPSSIENGTLLREFSKQNFEDLFITPTTMFPQRISTRPEQHGENLVLWLSKVPTSE